MKLFAFDPPIGIVRDGTEYSSKGAWNHGDKIRFRGGKPQRIGGWVRMTVDPFLGVCRTLIQWVTLGRVRLTGIFTNSKFYISSSDNTLFDRTPLRPSILPSNPISTTITSNVVTITSRSHGLSTDDRVLIYGITGTINNIPDTEINGAHAVFSAPTADTFTIQVTTPANASGSGGGTVVYLYTTTDFTVPLPASPFSTVNGSNVVTVNHPSHGAGDGDYVIILNDDGSANTLNGITIAAASGGTEYQIDSIVDANNFTILGANNANATSSGGGSIASIQYLYPTGLVDYSYAVGWGSGGWGSGVWGVGAGGSTDSPMRTWSADSYGEDLIFNPAGGPIFYYDSSVDTRGVMLAAMEFASNVPLVANLVLTDPADRRVLAFGCNGYNDQIADPLLVRWSDQENPFEWNPSSTTTANYLRINVGSRIITAARARSEILIWTESALSSLQFVDEFIYGQNLISPNTDILSAGSVAMVDDSAFWIGRENFFVYNGRVDVMPCSVRQYVFSNINLDQASKIFAAHNRAFREIWWFYPSGNASENDSYVVFNYIDKSWYYGTMERTAWSDTGVSSNPLAASADGYLYFHESGLDDGSTSPATAIEAFIESGPIELGEGDDFVFVGKIIPDVTFDGSDTSDPAVTYTLEPKRYPGSTFGTSTNDMVSQTATAPVEAFTEKIDTRLRGRHFLLRVSSAALGVAWRLGTNRFQVRALGRK